VILLLTATHALAQFKSGTIIVVGWSEHKVVIASDSRGREENGSYRDDSCKIVALNDKFLFASSGRPRDVTGGIVGWDAAEQAKTALTTILKQAEGGTDSDSYFAKKVADVWRNLMIKNINDHIRRQEVARLKPKQIYVDGLFIAGGPVQSRVAYAVIARNNDNAAFFLPELRVPSELSDKTTFNATGGESAIFLEFLNDTSDRAKKERLITDRLSKKWTPQEADARMAIRLVDLVIKYGPPSDVGPPVDAAQLSVGHTIHWIQRKENCKRNQ